VVDDPGTGYSVAPGVVIRDGTQANPINNRAQDRAKAARVDIDPGGEGRAQRRSPEEVEQITFANMVARLSTLFMHYVTVNTFGAGYTSAPTVNIVDINGGDRHRRDGAGLHRHGRRHRDQRDRPAPATSPRTASRSSRTRCPGCASRRRARVTTRPSPTEQQAKFIPAGVPEVKAYNGVEADEYVIALMQYRTSFSSSLKRPRPRAYP
jgi:hypothetical protein